MQGYIGEVGWPEVEAWMARLAAEADAAADRTPLPPEPDRRRVEDFLFRARRASALEAGPYDEVVQRVVRDGGVRQV